MSTPRICRNCRHWHRESLVYGDCTVRPEPVQTLGNYGCALHEPKDTAPVEKENTYAG